MKILVAANQKGGVGKTAALVHLAFDFLERGLKVAVIDLDTQANASYTLAQYKGETVASDIFFGDPAPAWISPEEGTLLLIASDTGLVNLEQLPLPEAISRFRESIRQIRDQEFDICLIDTAPSMGVGLMSALYVSDYVLSPIELEAYSIQGIKKLLTTISNVRRTTVPGVEPNTGLKFLGMLPSKVDARKPRQVRNLAELQAAYPELLVPLNIGFRDGIAEALASGIPVWQIKSTAARKAALETKAMAKYVLENMGLKT